MEIRQLRYFITIVDLGSISSASRRLGVAQPALSQQVAKLEAELDTQLLIRSVRGVDATPSGQSLYRNAHIILRQIEHARGQARVASEVPSGPVSIGFPTSIASTLALPVLAAVRENYPQITLRIYEGLSGDIRDLVATSKLDLALLFSTSVSAGMVTTPIFRERLYLIEAPIGGVASDGEVSFSALDGEPMLLPSSPHGLRQLAERAFQQAGVSLKVICEVDSLPTIKAAVAAGHGKSLLPWSAISREAAEKRLLARPMEGPAGQRIVSLCTSEYAPPSAAVTAIALLIQDVVTRIVDEQRPAGVTLLPR